MPQTRAQAQKRKGFYMSNTTELSKEAVLGQIFNKLGTVGAKAFGVSLSVETLTEVAHEAQLISRERGRYGGSNPTQAGCDFVSVDFDAYQTANADNREATKLANKIAKLQAKQAEMVAGKTQAA
jgi:hypothetical protein